jgi:glycerol-3-phosphate dehydrogenase
MSFSYKEREIALGTIKSNPPELLVIGGGIVGCSIAAHASRLGLNCLLLERQDLACGASGYSTGLAHAGLRYLAQGQVLYVFHESRERQRLEDLAPHWVRPFSFILPAYADDPFPFWMVRLGTTIYDLFTQIDAFLVGRPKVRGHRVLSAEEVRAKIPGLRLEGLRGGIEYYVDARLQDSRFTLGYAQQAARYGARIATYAAALSVDCVGDAAPRVSGLDYLGGQTFELLPPLAVNATGAWIDDVRATAGLKAPLVRKSRGIHLIVDHIADSPLIMSAAAKGKVFFVIPFDSERSLVGTTDTPTDAVPDQTRPDAKEVQELLQQLFYFFPYLKQGPNLQEAMESYKQVHVRSVTWGVRPLLYHEGPTLKATREHRLVKDRPCLWSIPGVKLTAARGAGFEVAAKAWRHLRPNDPLPKVTWDSLPGGELWEYERFVRDAKRRFRLGGDSEDIIAYLVSAYGTRYVEVLQWAQRESHLSERVLAGEPWIYAEAAYAAHEEMVLTLNDFLWRRTKWALLRALPPDAVERIAAILGQFLSWTPEALRAQIQSFHEELARHQLP